MLLLVTFVAKATIFYSNNATPGADANDLSNWDDNLFGAGTAPANFNGTDVFYVAPGHSYRTTAALNVPNGGVGSGGGTLFVNHTSSWSGISLLNAGVAGKVTVANGVTINVGTYFSCDNIMTIDGGNASTSIVVATGSTIEGTLGTCDIAGTVYLGTTTSSVVGGGVFFKSAVQHSSASSTFTNNGTVVFTKFNESNAVSNSNIVNAATGTLYINSSASTDFMPRTLTATAAGNTVRYYTSGDQPVYSTTYYNVIMENGGTKTAAGNVAVTNLLTITDASVFDVGTTTLNGAGGLTMAASACELRIAKSGATAQPELTGTYTLGAGSTITLDQAGATNQIARAETYANLKLDGGNASSTFDLSNVTSITGDLTITGSSNMNSNAVLGVTGALSYSSSIASTLTNNITIGSFDMTSGGGTLNAGSNTIEVNNGDWTHSSGTFNYNTSTVKFTGGSTRSINGTTATQEFYNLTVEKTAGTLLNTGGSVTTVTVNNTFTQTTGNFTAPTTINFMGDATLSAGTYTAGTNTNFHGNVTFGNTFTPGTNQTFTGASSQAITKTGTASFNNLIINKSANHVTLNDAMSVNTSLTLTQGKIITTTTDVLTLELGATTTIGDSDSYIDGPMKYVVAGLTTSDDFNFPVGKGSAWRPFVLDDLTHTDDITTTYTAEMFNASAAALGYTLPGTIDQVSEERYWDITTSGANFSSSRIRLYYDADDGVDDFANLAVVKTIGSGTTWIDFSGTATGNTTGSILSTAFGTFSKFTLGNKSGGSNPLPVELLHFNANYNNGKVDVEWSTASETVNDYFVVERSKDAIDFEEVVRVNGAGSSNVLNNYVTMDPDPYSGTSYYRLKQVDFNGDDTYYDPVAVFSQGIDVVKIFPNPSNGSDFNIELSESLMLGNSYANLMIYTIDGKQIFTRELTINKKRYSMQDMVDELSPGAYFIELQFGDKRLKERLMVF